MAESRNRARSRGHFPQLTTPDDPQTAALRAAVAKHYPAALAPGDAQNGRQGVFTVSDMRQAAAQHLLGMPGYADRATGVAEALSKQALLPKQLRLGDSLCNLLRKDLLFNVGPVVQGSQRQVDLNVQVLLSAAVVVKTEVDSHYEARAPDAPRLLSHYGSHPTESQLKAKQEKRQKQQTDTRSRNVQSGTQAKKAKTADGVKATAGSRAAATAAVAAAAGGRPATHVPMATVARQAAAADARMPTVGPLQLLPPAGQSALAPAGVPSIKPGVSEPHNQQQREIHTPDVCSCHRCQRMEMITSMFNFGSALVKAGAAVDTVLQFIPWEEAKQLAASAAP